jgi:hypothetical protein
MKLKLSGIRVIFIDINRKGEIRVSEEERKLRNINGKKINKKYKQEFCWLSNE